MELIAFILVILFICALALPWINLARISSLQREIEALENKVESQRKELVRLEPKHANKKAQKAKQAEKTAPKPIHLEKRQAQETPKETPDTPPDSVPTESEPTPSRHSMADPKEALPLNGKPAPTSQPAANLATVETRLAEIEVASEDWFGNVAVWVGGVALLMAGFFMIKYAIDTGWLTPIRRLWITTIFGGILCSAGFLVSRKTTLRANETIGQALSGAGIACLYFASYAAVHLYGFMGKGSGFGCMVMVTVLAIALSLRNGAPIALMGLIGGFLTPYLMSTGTHDTVSLFTYLFLLYGAAQVLCYVKGWWLLSILALFGAYIWSVGLLIGWAADLYAHADGTLVFLLGICGLNMAWTLFRNDGHVSNAGKKVIRDNRAIIWAGGLLQALAVLWLGDFGTIDMGMSALLCLGALVLSVLRDKEFYWGGYLAYGFVAVSALINPESNHLIYFAWPVGLGILCFAVSYMQYFRSAYREAWLTLSLTVLLSLLPILYLNREFIQLHSLQPIQLDLFWLLAASILAAIGFAIVEHLKRNGDDAHPNTQSNTHSQTAFAIASFLLLGGGLWEYLPRSYWAHAAGGLLILTMLYWKARKLNWPEVIAGIFTGAWLLNMIFPISGAFSYLIGFGDADTTRAAITLSAWGIGVIAFYAAYRQSREPLFVWITGISALLAVASGYAHVADLAMPTEWSHHLVDGGLTALLAVLAAIALAIGKRGQAGLVASWVLGGLCIFRLVTMHLINDGAKGDSFFFNGLLLQFGFPFIASYALAWMCRERGHKGSACCYQIAAMGLAFIWSTFLVQDFFGGNRLIDGAGDAEMYTYSVVWLLLAIAYQSIGLLREIQTLHVGSLLLLLITVGKVFLMDAAHLVGMYRVLSFLGLGVALIGIGYFYNKVIFKRNAANA